MYKEININLIIKIARDYCGQNERLKYLRINKKKRILGRNVSLKYHNSIHNTLRNCIYIQYILCGNFYCF